MKKSFTGIFNKLSKRFKTFYFWTFFLSLLIVLPLGTLTGSILVFRQNYIYQLQDFHNSFTQTIASNVKNTLLDARKLRVLFSQSRYFENLLLIDDSEQYFSSDSVKYLIDDMNAYKLYMPNVDLMYIYVEKTDTIIYGAGIKPASEFYDIYFANTIDFNTWKSQLTELSSNEYYPVDAVVNDSKNEYICFSSPINLSKTIDDHTQTKLFLLVNSEKFTNEADMNFDCYSIYVFDKNGNTLISKTTDPETSVPSTLQELLAISKDYSVNTKNYIIDTAEIIIATSVFTKELMYNLNAISILCCIAAILTAGLCSWLIFKFMREQYAPIDNALSLLNVSPNSNKTEMQSLQEKICSLLQKNSLFTQTINSNNSFMENFVLTQILADKYSQIRDQFPLSKHITTFSHKNYVLTMFYWDNLAELFNDPDLSLEVKQNDIEFILKNIFEEIANTNEINSKFFVVNGTPVLVSNTDIDLTDIRRFLQAKISYGVDIIKEAFFAKISYVISGTHFNLLDLPTMLSEAQYIKAYKSAFDIEDNIAYDDVNHKEFHAYLYSDEYESKLISSLLVSDLVEANSMIDTFFTLLLQNSDSPEYVDSALQHLTNTLIKVTPDTDAQNNLKNVLNSEKAIFGKKIAIQEIIKNLCFAFAEENTQNLHQKILNYILSNYSDTTLGVNTIASHFGLSSYYISQTFKKCYDSSIPDFIHNFRLEKAKELIEKGQYTFFEISGMIGYSSIRSFNRIFKKYTGITPTEYKNQL